MINMIKGLFIMVGQLMYLAASLVAVMLMLGLWY